MSGLSNQPPNWGAKSTPLTPAQLQQLNKEMEEHQRMVALEYKMKNLSVKRGGRGKKPKRFRKSRRVSNRRRRNKSIRRRKN
jgi:hypothetical protein